jgi:hypothetical protein
MILNKENKGGSTLKTLKDQWQTYPPVQRLIFCFCLSNVFFVLLFALAIIWEIKLSLWFVAASFVSVVATILAFYAMFSTKDHYSRYNRGIFRPTLIIGGKTLSRKPVAKK